MNHHDPGCPGEGWHSRDYTCAQARSAAELLRCRGATRSGHHRFTGEGQAAVCDHVGCLVTRRQLAAL